MKNSDIKEGDIYFIPLFLSHDFSTKSYSRFKFGDPGQEFCFCRLISYEFGSGIFIEVFDYVGDLRSNAKDIVSNPRLFDPVTIVGEGITKKRWRKVGESEHYDKEKDSKYSEITFVMGRGEDRRIWRNKNEFPISEFKDIDSIEPFRLLTAAQLENRIIKILSEK